MVKSLGNDFFEAVADGGQEAAKELGNVTSIYQSPAASTAEGQIEIIESLIAQRVDGIAISANDRDALIPVTKKAMAAGIKVIPLTMGYTSANGAGTISLVVIGMVVGVAAGVFNGICVTKVGMPAIVVTLAIQSIFRGIPQAVLGDKDYTQYPASFAYFGQGYAGNTFIPFSLVFSSSLRWSWASCCTRPVLAARFMPSAMQKKRHASAVWM